jgi:CubicO group peptidase (beta-lactamase class C family)
MKKLRIKACITVISVILLTVAIASVLWNVLGTLFSEGNYNDVDGMVKTVMDKSATPGLAMVISKQGKLEYKYYGYADISNKKRITEESLFELGSTTKAFTALAIMLLEDEGYLSTVDSVTDYLPWFKSTYNGKQVDITIDQLLAHTSGIPSWSIRLIPEGTSEYLLEKTVYNISNIKLDTYPGTQYNYATINYDVLALIIEKVTEKSYQYYINENILLPLGMKDSYFPTEQVSKSDKLTKGYRGFFGRSLEYDAPRYYGNIAAGYLVTNIKDIGRWINAQMGMGTMPDHLRSVIKRSHEVNKQTAGYEDENKYYSFGWNINLKKKVLNHGGSNPNYASQAIIDLEKQEAIFVLANLNSSAPTQIAYNVYADMNGGQMGKFSFDDLNILLDLVFSILSIIVVVGLYHKIINLVKYKKPNIKYENTGVRKIVGIYIGLILRILLLVFLFIWPYLLNYNYYYIWVWMSYAILVWEGFAIINCILLIVIRIRGIAAIRRYIAV